MTAVPFEEWAARLDDAIRRGVAFDRVHVVHDVGSTQDEARAIGAKPGMIVVAWRQHRGRGRMGREWADTADAGVALTAVLPRGESMRLALAGGIAAREACARVFERAPESGGAGPGTMETGTMGPGAMEAGTSKSSARPTAGDERSRTGPTSTRPTIKWPNDILVDGRKLAGVLVEQDDRTALMGIGINVAQRTWPDSIAGRATSLALLGCAVDRIDVACALVNAIDRAVRRSDAELVAEFAAHDGLRGTRRRFRCGEVIVEGIVRDIDPLRHIRVERDDGTVALLPVELTSTE